MLPPHGYWLILPEGPFYKQFQIVFLFIEYSYVNISYFRIGFIIQHFLIKTCPYLIYPFEFSLIWGKAAISVTLAVY